LIPPTLLRTKASDISPAPTLHPSCFVPRRVISSSVCALPPTAHMQTQNQRRFASSRFSPPPRPFLSVDSYAASSLLIVSPRPLLSAHRVSTSPPLSSSYLHVPSPLFIVSPRPLLSLHRVSTSPPLSLSCLIYRSTSMPPGRSPPPCSSSPSSSSSSF